MGPTCILGSPVSVPSPGCSSLPSDLSAGVSDQLAQDEFEAALKAREWIASLNWAPPQLPRTVKLPIVEPLYSPGARPCSSLTRPHS